MNTLRKLCSVMLAGSALPPSGAPALPAQTNQVKTLVDGNTVCAVDLYDQFKARR